MKLKDKNILLISPEPWDHLFVSKHHYAIHLVEKGNHVFFLNPPKSEYQVNSTKYKGLKVVEYKGFWKGLKYLPFFLRKKNQLSVFKTLQKLVGAEFDIVWSFDNSVFFDFNSLPSKILCISHIVDLNQNFQFSRASSSANICLGVIQEIVDKHLLYNKNSFLIRHGVTIHSVGGKKVTLPGLNKIKVMYAGSLDMPFIDWDLLSQASNIHTNVDFILVGKDVNYVKSMKKKEVFNSTNVYKIGPFLQDEFSSYLHASDILLLAYLPDYYINYASPHKLVEYLSTGKPIVASYTSDYQDQSHLLYMGKGQVEWLNLLDYTIKNLKECSSAELIKKRVDFSKRNSYQNQLNLIEQKIKDLS